MYKFKQAISYYGWKEEKYKPLGECNTTSFIINMKNQLYIHLKNSRRPKHYRYVMYGDNTEHMMESELIENTTYLKKLMKRFEKMGFVIKNLTKLKL